MFTTFGWTASQDSGGVLTAVAAIPDPHLRIVGNDVVVPSLNKLLAAAVNGATLTNAQLQSPTLRRTVNLDLADVVVNANLNGIHQYLDRIDNPIDLDIGEALNLFESEAAAGAERVSGFAWLGDGDTRIPTGDPYVVRATASTTLAAFAWTNAALTFTQALPAGQYAVVGAKAFSAGLQAFRLVFSGYSWRPGGIGGLTIGGFNPEFGRNGRLGQWGTFAHNVPPTVDFFSATADTSEVVFLELIKIAGA